MAGVLKSEELSSYRQVLESLRSRLRGDLDQMTDEALGRDDGASNHSKVPLHLADLGTDNYDQEFTLSLIQNEQETLDLVNEAIARLANGGYGLCVGCGQAIAKPRLQAIPYARHCILCARKLEGEE